MSTLRLIVTGFILLVLPCYISIAQAVGDYRSVASGNWSSTATWETWGGISWIVAVSTPTSSDNTVTIRSPHEVTVTTNVTVDQVVVDAGGQITVNSAVTVTLNNGTGDDLVINGTLALPDGSLSGTGTVSYGSTGVLLYNGTTQTTTSIEFPSTNGPSNITIDGGANVTLHAARTINGTLSIANGTLADGGNQIGAGGSSTLTVGAFGTLKLGGSGAATTFPLFNTIILDVESTVEYAATGVNQVVSTVPDYGYLTFSAISGSDLKIPESGPLTILDAWYVGGVTDLSVNNPTVNAAGNVSSGFSAYIIMGSNNLNVAGNWSVDRAEGGSGAVVFTGVAPTIGPAFGTEFENVTFNNSTGASLVGNATVYGTLTLTTGKLDVGSKNLVLGVSATISGTPSATNMIVAEGVGQVQKRFTGTGSFLFPVGDNTGTAEYSPVTVSFAGGTFGGAASVNVNLADAKHSSNSSTTDFISRYWKIQQSDITGITSTVTLNYVDADINGTEANLYCGAWSGSAWTLLNAVNAASNQLSGTVTAFSDFTGGEPGVLPVQLKQFIAEGGVRNAELRWKTETEVDNYGFEVERREISLITADTRGFERQNDGASQRNNSQLTIRNSNWEKVGFVSGSGTSSSPHEYWFSDHNLSAGRYAYRIKQIDHSGLFAYTSAVEVEVGLAPREFALNQNYPNPFNPTTTIEFTLPQDGRAVLKIYDIAGREVATLLDEERKAGVYQQVLFDASKIASGTYFSSIQFNGKQLLKKMILIK